MPRKGRNLEILIKCLEENLGQAEANFSSLGFVEDRITGEAREVDVLIEKGVGHHKHLIAIECRDRKALVGSPDIEAFKTKVSGLKINKTVLVSTSGFTKPALKKAEFYNISCLALDELDRFDWLLTDHMVKVTNKIVSSHWQIYSEEEPPNGAESIVLKDVEGTTITQKMIEANTHRYFETIDKTNLESEKLYAISIPISPANLALEDESSGETFQVSERSNLFIEFVQNQEFVPFRTYSYGDVIEGTNLTDAAACDVAFGAHEGQIVIAEQKDGSKIVYYVPTKVA